MIGWINLASVKISVYGESGGKFSIQWINCLAEQSNDLIYCYI